MTDLKAIHVNGEMTLIFDEGLEVSLEETVEKEEVLDFAELLQKLFDVNGMSEEEREYVLSMSVRDFAQLSPYKASEKVEAPLPTWGVSKMHLLANLSKYSCLYCGTPGTLRITDGHLLCVGCQTLYGDIDDLPDIV